MALRVVLGAVLASVVMFVWGAVFWMLLPAQFAVTRSLPTDKQVAVAEVLKTQLTADGAYWLPSPDEAQDRADDENSPFMQRHRQGPVVQIMYRQSGIEPMSHVVLAALSDAVLHPLAKVETATSVHKCLALGSDVGDSPAMLGYGGRDYYGDATLPVTSAGRGQK